MLKVINKNAIKHFAREIGIIRENMTLLEYIKKVNVGFDELSPAEQMRISLSFLSKYLVVQSYYVEVDGQRYRLN